MRTQHIKMRANDGSPVVIETAHGLIRIHDDGGRRRLLIELPDDLEAHVGEDRAYEHAKYVERVNGVDCPTYRVLAPEVGENGTLLGVCRPGVLRIGGSNEHRD